MGYEKDIIIDESNLDLECLDQPSLMLKYSRICADAHLEMEKAKQGVDLVRAQLDYQIRVNPDDYEITVKLTETVISGAITQQDPFIDAQKEYLEKRHDYEVLKGAVNAFEQRKTALELLIKLHGMQYFAGPSVPRNLVEQREQRSKKTNAGISSKMQRKRS